MYEQLRFIIREGMVEIVNHYPGRYGAPGVKRQPKRKKTPEEMEKANQRNRAKKLQRLILANFDPGDFHLVLSYGKEKPASMEEAKKDLKKFLASMRRRYKSKGCGLQYIGVTEKGKRASSYHHHLILKNIRTDQLDTMQAARKFWEGHCAWFDLYEEGDFADLAAYIVKKETKEENEGASYTRSRNLKEPVLKKVSYKRRTWPKEPKPKKGWFIVKDSVTETINAFTGLPSQTYITRRFDEGVRSCLTSTYT